MKFKESEHDREMWTDLACGETFVTQSGSHIVYMVVAVQDRTPAKKIAVDLTSGIQCVLDDDKEVIPVYFQKTNYEQKQD